MLLHVQDSMSKPRISANRTPHVDSTTSPNKHVFQHGIGQSTAVASPQRSDTLINI